MKFRQLSDTGFETYFVLFQKQTLREKLKCKCNYLGLANNSRDVNKRKADSQEVYEYVGLPNMETQLDLLVFATWHRRQCDLP